MKKELTEIQKEWIAALRSGKYKQGMHALRSSNDEFCCLGVLCDIAFQHHVVGEPRPVVDGLEYGEARYYAYEGDCNCLPTAVRDWSGLACRDGAPQCPGFRVLTDMNDSGAAFEEIANEIEQHPEAYFV